MATEVDLAIEESHIVQFGQAYAQWHGYISLGICMLSILANTANVVVLTRRKMRSPSNLLLTAIAFADILKMTSYCAFAVRFNILSRVSDPQSFGWMVFLIAHTHFVLVLHAITTWLTVTLANFRYLIICTKNGARKITNNVAKLSILLATMCSAVMYVPQYVAIGIMPWSPSDENDSYVSTTPEAAAEAATHVKYNFTEAGDVDNVTTVSADYPAETLYTHSDGDSLLYNLSHIIHGPVLKLLASVLITVPTMAVIAKMRRAAEKRATLIYNSSISSCRVPVDSSEPSVAAFGTTLLTVPLCKHSVGSRGQSTQPTSASDGRFGMTTGNEKYAAGRTRSAAHMERHHRTTLMLVAVVISFVIAELPQGVLLLIGCFNTYIQEVVYYRLSDFVDLLVLLYSAINFVLYCSMSQQFRTVFRETFITPVRRTLWQYC